jgi:hypothetical protein
MTRSTELPNIPEDIRKLVEEGKSLPPVDKWHPEREGEIDIRIARDGQWYFQGDLMTREATVRLFSTILRRDGHDYFLVTPAEKQKIQVDDVPFIVRLMDVEEAGTPAQKIHFSTNVGDSFTLSSEHVLEMLAHGDDVAPYVRVRGALKARLSSPVYYELVRYVEEDAQGRVFVRSDGTSFYLS